MKNRHLVNPERELGRREQLVSRGILPPAFAREHIVMRYGQPGQEVQTTDPMIKAIQQQNKK